MSDPEALLADLNDAQRRAATSVEGPVCILAGAGTGKTRVISRRVAYAVASGKVDPRRVLVVTFTDKAAGEMVERLRALRLPAVAARTFHAAALLQLRHFWPRLSDAPFPAILASKVGLIARLLAREGPPLKFTPARDVADAIEWAKVNRVAPGGLGAAADAAGKALPSDAERIERVWRAYERAKERAGQIDFEDMLTRTVELLESDAEAAEIVRSRYTWFSVDEYQDTNPLQESLLGLWLGDRHDVAVVGDPNQTIYTFTGATSDYLTSFSRRHPGTQVVRLVENYRSSPEILAAANRLLAVVGQSNGLRASRPSGPAPSIRAYADADAERAALVEEIRAAVGAGIALAAVAILVRINAQIPELEAALATAGIPYQVRGERFFARPEIREALDALRALPAERRGAPQPALAPAIEDVWGQRLGFSRRDEPATDAARERQAALEALLEIAADPAAGRTVDDFLAEVARRAELERTGSADGVTISTIHRAKGLEWDAVLLPSFEETLLPFRSALGSPAGIAEERRLAYVAITRARSRLWIGWARSRPGARGGETRRPSRFLADLTGETPGARDRRRVAPGTVTVLPGAADTPRPDSRSPLFDALRAWRSARAREDGVPAYVVAPDRTLEAIADARPRSLAQLRRCHGMGEKKLALYGEEILAITATA